MKIDKLINYFDSPSEFANLINIAIQRRKIFASYFERIIIIKVKLLINKIKCIVESIRIDKFPKVEINSIMQ